MMPHRLRSEIPLIFASLFIAFVIWLIAEQANLDTDWISAPVQLVNVPDNMIIDQPKPVRINVRYPEDLKNRVVDLNFSIPIDISQIFPEDPRKWDEPTSAMQKTYNVRPSDVRSELFPAVQVLETQPKELTLVGRLRTQEVNVHVQTLGQLPENLTFVADPKAEPPTVLLTGPTDALNTFAISKAVDTEPINLATLQTSTQVYPALRLPRNVVLLGRPDNRIPVNIALTEKPVRQTLIDVPINLVTITGNLTAKVDPPTAEVVLEGPASVVSTLTAADIVFNPARDLVEQPGQVFEVGLEARLKNTVPAATAQHVRIVEVKPSRITVEYVPLDKQDKDVGFPLSSH